MKRRWDQTGALALSALVYAPLLASYHFAECRHRCLLTTSTPAKITSDLPRGDIPSASRGPRIPLMHQRSCPQVLNRGKGHGKHILNCVYKLSEAGAFFSRDSKFHMKAGVSFFLPSSIEKGTPTKTKLHM